MSAYFNKTTSAAPLAVFRLLFGLMLFGSIVRFWSNGWIAELYQNPHYFFPFYGFEFVKPLGEYTCLLFAICGLSALLVAIGLFYRVASISLFLSFTYIELIDKSTYLNHYYFVSMVYLLLLFLPAHAYFSVDAYRHRTLLADQIPAWCIDSLKLFVALLTEQRLDFTRATITNLVTSPQRPAHHRLSVQLLLGALCFQHIRLHI